MRPRRPRSRSPGPNCPTSDPSRSTRPLSRSRKSPKRLSPRARPRHGGKLGAGHRHDDRRQRLRLPGLRSSPVRDLLVHAHHRVDEHASHAGRRRPGDTFVQGPPSRRPEAACGQEGIAEDALSRTVKTVPSAPITVSGLRSSPINPSTSPRLRIRARRRHSCPMETGWLLFPSKP